MTKTIICRSIIVWHLTTANFVLSLCIGKETLCLIVSFESGGTLKGQVEDHYEIEPPPIALELM